MSQASPEHAFEPRWPVVVTIAAVILLLKLLPGPIRLAPMYVTYMVGGMVLAPIVAVGLTAARARWLRVERAVVLVFFSYMVIVTLVNLANLIRVMSGGQENVTGQQLLSSSVAVWVTNVLIFSLLYWQMDRGGPESRVNRAGRRTDWLFPQESAPAEDVPPGWRPVFVDYLYLSYSTATAFSTTEVAPLTPRAKLLMMCESSISLATILLVAARAINILGS